MPVSQESSRADPSDSPTIMSMSEGECADEAEVKEFIAERVLDGLELQL